MDEKLEKLACGCCSTLIGAGVVLSDPNAVNCVMLPIVRSALREAQRMAYEDAAKRVGIEQLSRYPQPFKVKYFVDKLEVHDGNGSECTLFACKVERALNAAQALAASMKGE